MYQEVRLTNRGHWPCTLSGGPTAVTGVAVAGGMATLTRVAMGDGFNLAGLGPANLRPGHSGWVTLSYGDGCPALRPDYLSDLGEMADAIDAASWIGE